MIGILLTILKIIGIILLCILGLVIGILLIIFLVPIRYEAQGELYEEKDIKVKVHWLLHLLHVVVQLKGKAINVSVRIFGKKIFSMNKEPEEETKEAVKEEVVQEERKVEETKGEEIKVEETKEVVPEEALLEENVSEDVVVEEQKEEKTVMEKDERTVSEKIEDKLNQIADAIADKCENIEKTMEDLGDKIENIKKMIYHYTDLISHEKTQRLLKRLFKEIGGVFVHIAPKKLKVNLHIGMDNPATTGQICMYASMLYPIYKDNIQIEPDFEEKVLEGTFSFKGRIRLGHFVAMVLRLVVNKDFWYVIMHIKPKKQKIKEAN